MIVFLTFILLATLGAAGGLGAAIADRVWRAVLVFALATIVGAVLIAAVFLEVTP